MNRLCVVLVCCLLCSSPALAETVTEGPFVITFGTKNGPNPLATVRDNFATWLGEYRTKYAPTRDLTKAEKDDTLLALKYWKERIPGKTPGVTTTLFVGYTHNPDGSASSLDTRAFLEDDIKAKVSVNGAVVDALRDGKKNPYPDGLANNIIISNVGWSHTPSRQLLYKDSMLSTMMHEVGHALGIGTGYNVNTGGLSGTFTAEKFTSWNEHLRDVFGKEAVRGMAIAMNAQDGNKANVFQIYSDALADPAKYTYPMFRGTAVDTLTGNVGMPVMGGFSSAGNVLDEANGLGHPGVMQSIMSYGVLQNMPFSEMELAMFQDLGYKIDRSQFFGKSYYYTVGGDTQINATLFGSKESPNKAMFGLGLHIMRNNLNLTQTGSIYAHGYAGAGMRVDGVSNHLTLPSAVVVSANGDQGTGLLVSYGRNNTFDLRGHIEAQGPDGMGIQVGLQQAAFVQHSYIQNTIDPKLPIQKKYEMQRLNADLNGPLVERLDLRGVVSGSLAAISIGRDAHVKAINVFDGASILGNISSEWARNTMGGDYATTITFGETGKTGLTTMAGNITWSAHDSTTFGIPDNTPTNSLDVRQAGGKLNFNGNANISGWRIERGAILAGTNVITFNVQDGFVSDGTYDPKKTLVNDGTIAPGNSLGKITIEGNYIQRSSGDLEMEFDSASSDTLVVTGASTIDPGAELYLIPLEDYYDSDEDDEDDDDRVLTDEELFEGHLQAADFTVKLGPLDSPTLVGALQPGARGLTFKVQRAPDAYSRYATGANSRSVGLALSKVVDHAQGDMRKLFAILDFSKADGSDIASALQQLGPVVYDNAARASLNDTRNFAAMMQQQVLLSSTSNPASGFASAEGPSTGATSLNGGTPSAPGAPLQFFVLPYAGLASQDSWTDNPGYSSNTVGVVAGLNRQFEAGLAGVHVAFSHREVDTRSIWAKDKTSAVRLGGHALYRPTPEWYVSGVANIGLDSTTIRRNIDFDDYSRSNKVDFTALTAMASLRTGYEWQAGILHFGPLLGLEYAAYHRPGKTERNGQATRLHIEADTWQSLRSQLGVQLRTDDLVGNNMRLRASLSALWAHELIGASTTRASFADYRNAVMTSKQDHYGRDALVLQGSIGLDVREDVTLSAFAGTELLRKGQIAGQGGVALEWRF